MQEDARLTLTGVNVCHLGIEYVNLPAFVWHQQP